MAASNSLMAGDMFYVVMRKSLAEGAPEQGGQRPLHPPRVGAGEVPSTLTPASAAASFSNGPGSAVPLVGGRVAMGRPIRLAFEIAP